jgi:hypothetical protein
MGRGGRRDEGGEEGRGRRERGKGRKGREEEGIASREGIMSVVILRGRRAKREGG